MPKLKKKSRTTKYLIPLIVSAAVLIVIVGGVVALQLAFPAHAYTIIDENRIRNVQTRTEDLSQVLLESGTFLSANDTYTLEETDEETIITVQRAMSVTVRVKNEKQTVYSMGETVAQLLERLEISTEEPWEVSVPLEDQVYDGMTIGLDYVERTTNSVVCPMMYSTVYCYDPSLPEGEEELLCAGVCGMQETVTTTIVVNGAQESMTATESVELEAPVHQVVAVGTGESVGEPRKYPLFGDKVIVTAEGKYLYYSHVETFQATGYTSWIADVTGTTACGTPARVGAVAVDPKVIPYFTKMYIVSQDGVYVYGEASAEDCGGAIKGKIIDLFFDTEAECWQFGRRNISVYFLTDEPT